MRKLVLVASVLLLGAAMAQADLVATTSFTKDAYINAGAAATGSNYGTTTQIQAQANTRRTLAMFTLPGAVNNTITGVTITVSPTNNWTVGTQNVYALTRDWTEGNGTAGSGVTWMKYDGVTNWTTAGGDYGATVIGTMNVTAELGNATTPGTAIAAITFNADGLALANQWRLGTATNYGIIIGGGTGTAYFASNQHAAAGSAPVVSISYVPEPTTLSVLGLGALALLRRRR